MQTTRHWSIPVLFTASALLALFTCLLVNLAGVPGINFYVFVSVMLACSIVVLSGLTFHSIFLPGSASASFLLAISTGISVSSVAVLGIIELFKVNATVELLVRE